MTSEEEEVPIPLKSRKTESNVVSRKGIASQRSEKIILNISDSIVTGDIKIDKNLNSQNCCKCGNFGRIQCIKCCLLYTSPSPRDS